MTDLKSSPPPVGHLSLRRLVLIGGHLSTGYAVAVIAAVSLVIKLGYIATLGGGLHAFPAEGSDVYYYDTVARVLLGSGTFGAAPGQPATAVPPGQPVLLALIYAVTGGSIAAAKLVEIALTTLAAVLTYLIGMKLANPLTGLIAGLLTAIDPAYAYLSGTLLSEPLFICLMMVGVYCLILYLPAPAGWGLLGAGLCLGLAGLTRNEGWLFTLSLLAGALVTRGRLLSLRAAALTSLAVCIVVAPWTIRNYAVSGRFILVASNGGLNLWSGNNPEFLFRQPMPMSLPIYSSPTNLSEYERDQYFRQRAFEWISAHPASFVVNGLRKIAALYSFDPLSSRSAMADLYRVAGFFPYGLLLPFILLGSVSCLRQPQFRILYWHILFVTGLAFVFFGDSRLRTAIQPHLYLFGALGLQRAISWWPKQRGRSTVN